MKEPALLRRWSIPFATLALVVGSVAVSSALAAGAASAAVHPAVHHAVRGWNPGGVMHHVSGVAPAAGGVRHADQSTNWSGYAVTGGTGAFSSISASWTEPTGHCSGSRKYSSFWVGLDGFNSNSVEQTGSEVDCSGRTALYYSWYEMFPAAPVNYANTVRPGDHFTASVTFSGTSTYTLTISDTTQGWSHSTVKSQSGLARSSAEVITEAPSSSSGVLPLANFGTVTYSASAANGASLGGQAPTQIIMVNNSGAPKDSTSAINSAGGFSNTWIRAN
jgi:Peptidase A4 family